MVKMSLLSLALVGCLEVPSHRRPRQPDPAIAAAADAFAALGEASSIPVTLTATRGIPSAISMAVPLPDGAPIDAAYAFLEAYAPVYGLDAPRDQLWPRSTYEADGAHIRFVQRSTPEQGGLPLFNSGLTVHVHEGVVYLTTGRYVPHLKALPPRLGWEDALAAATFEPPLESPEVQGEARLGLYAAWSDRGATVYTVWRMTVTGRVARTGEPIRWRVDIDARTGQVVHHVDLVNTCDKDFDIMYGSHTDAATTCWAGWADTEDWFDEDGPLEDYSPTADHNGDATRIYGHAHTVFDWYRDRLGHCSYDDDDAEVEIVTHAAVPNASASGACGTMQFSDDFSGLDVVAHEFTHLVDYNHNDLEYENQSGALDESFADVMACLVDGNWTIGEGHPGVIRDLADPPARGQPEHFSDYVSGGDVHHNSGIPNKAAWLTMVGDTHNGYQVRGLGTTKGRFLYHVVHIGGLEDDADFRDARDALVGTATYWGVTGIHGFGPSDRCEVAKAWAAVGIGVADADSDCDGVADGNDGDDDNDGTPDSLDGCPHVPDPAQADADGDGIGDACDDDRDGDGVDDDDDNCPNAANDGQQDSDGDGIGDACSDRDEDGIIDAEDSCPDQFGWNQVDTDHDGLGDACDDDIDGDGVPNATDNCPNTRNGDQADRDGDGVGDLCDNCPTNWNPDQGRCDCPDGLVEEAFCDGAFDPIQNTRVHPLDEVALPWVDVLDAVPFDDYWLELTMVGTSTPWVVIDHQGDVVARSVDVSGPTATRTATWAPALDYRYAEQGDRASFATGYALQLSPELDARGVDVRLQIEALAR